ncbi:MAG: CDP-diacylglycerol--serine O-phosphatidyltransferase [Pseudomonadales bacterium]|nr:CDP-diacylglycerol--serine O-phosphatidyltransferase [Pseudomonadales bacterium]
MEQETATDDLSGGQLGLPVDEHVEEVSEDGRRVRRRGVYLLPNLLTTGALFAGFYAIVASMNGQFGPAAIAIFVAMFFDGLDGRVARLTNTQSAFGVQYDSLSDMVSFGVAPALVAFNWALSALGKPGWAAAFLYVAGAALRLARFNTQAASSDNRFFRGLASPAAAALLASLVWTATDFGLVREKLPVVVAVIAAVLTAGAGVLMVSNFRYHSFKKFDFRRRVPFVIILLPVLVIGVVSLDPPRILLLMAIVYALSAPLQFLLQRRSRRTKSP